MTNTQDLAELVNRLRRNFNENQVNIPDDLKNCKAWLVWETTEIQPSGKFNKIPFYPATGRRRKGQQGSDSDLANLGTWADCVAAMDDSRYAGVGFACLPCFGIVALDLDHCIKDDVLNTKWEWVLEETFCEVSPSGTGLRAFWTGTARNGKNHDDGVELFHSTGFVTVTGDYYEGGVVNPLSDALRSRLEELSSARGSTSSASNSLDLLSPKLNDIDRLALNASNDLMINAIKRAGLYERDMGNGKHSIRCPFEEEHSDLGRSGGDGDTAYFQPHTNGYPDGFIYCHHTHSGNQTAYWQKIGFNPLGTQRRSLMTIDSETGEIVGDSVELIKGSSLKPEPIQWLWQGWLPLGKLTILAGEPGTGKTTAVLSFAATVSNGGAFPDGATCPEGDVLIWSGEDDPGDTLLPRLIAAGANTDRIFFVGDRTVTGDRRPFDPASDVGVLLDTAQELPKLRLIVFDPVVNAITGDSHKNTEVRRALQPLVDFASKVGAVLIGITHFSKGGQGSDPTKRVMGSVAFTAVARVVMVCAKTKDDDGVERRVFARSKSNVGPDDGGFAYGLEQVQALPGIWASKTVWGEALTGSAMSLLAVPESDEKQGAVVDAVQFLRDCLSDGMTPIKTLKAEAIDAGISWSSIRRASDQIRILKRKGGMNDGWYWSLPTAEGAQNSRRCSTKKGEHLRENVSTFEETANPSVTNKKPPTSSFDDPGVTL